MADIAPRDVRLAAMNLLARREHSRRELNTKLMRRFADVETVAVVVDQLAEERLQSDERFTELFIRSRAHRGYGPIRIRRELKAKGVSSELVSSGMTASRMDWSLMAQQVLLKKYGDQPAGDLKEKAKRLRFMYLRGFDVSTLET